VGFGKEPKRTVKVPAILHPHLQRLACDKLPTAYLFPGKVGGEPDSGVFTVRWRGCASSHAWMRCRLSSKAARSSPHFLIRNSSQGVSRFSSPLHFPHASKRLPSEFPPLLSA
jgi:hypothetical protein